jgi:hypothetical protein
LGIEKADDVVIVGTKTGGRQRNEIEYGELFAVVGLVAGRTPDDSLILHHSGGPQEEQVEGRQRMESRNDPPVYAPHRATRRRGFRVAG